MAHAARQELMSIGYIEVDEEQHQEETPFFDKPARITVSGVHRGIQRRLYDERKRQAARQQGYKLIEIPWSRRRKPRPEDLEELRSILRSEGVLGMPGARPRGG